MKPLHKYYESLSLKQNPDCNKTFSKDGKDGKDDSMPTIPSQPCQLIYT
ncbi:MAG: hypothetical protein VXY77_02245 [Pseudomonadota bacterium]|nr:hypothetical protein [Pseudomonadota bacterium]